MNNKQRSTDGFTFNKVLLGMLGFTATICLALVTYIYTTDRLETRGNLRSITTNVHDIAVSQKLQQAYQANMEARVTKVEKVTDKHIDEYKRWKEEVRAYWQSRGHK